MQKPGTFDIDAITSLKNINTTAQRILADQKRKIDAIRREHPEVDCESLVRNLSILNENNTEEGRLLSLATSGNQAAASSIGWTLDEL
jgi:hypothetical protein